MPSGTEEILKFSRWLGAFNRCTNKNVDGMKLIILLLFEDIKANLFYPSAGFLNRCPRLPLGPRSGLPGATSRGRDIANPTDEQGATSFDSLYKEATNYERLKTTALVLVDSSI